MSCDRCGARCQGKHCSQCELELSHEGMKADDTGWALLEDEEGEE